MAVTNEYLETRRVAGYPPRKFKKLMQGYATDKKIGMSEAVVTAIIQFFDAFPESEKRRLLSLVK